MGRNVRKSIKWMTWDELRSKLSSNFKAQFYASLNNWFWISRHDKYTRSNLGKLPACRHKHVIYSCKLFNNLSMQKVYSLVIFQNQKLINWRRQFLVYFSEKFREFKGLYFWGAHVGCPRGNVEKSNHCRFLPRAHIP